jgi:hypothetical protein
MNYANSSLRIRELETRNRELEKSADDSDILGSSPEIDYLRRRLRTLHRIAAISVFFLRERQDREKSCSQLFQEIFCQGKKSI